MGYYYKCFCGIISWALLSCNEPGITDRTDNRVEVVQQERLIPYHEDATVKNDRQQLFLNNLSMIIGLPTIKNDSEGSYVRIWLWDGERKYIITISKNGSTNKCHIIEWNSTKKDTTDYILIHKAWNVVPKSGWDNLWAVLASHRIFDLPGIRPHVKQKGHLTTMAYVQFEIARHDQYRYYEYLEPSFYRYVDEDSRTVHEFLKYLRREINYSVYAPAEQLFLEPEHKAEAEPGKR